MTDNGANRDKVEGKVKETAGKLTGDKDTEAEGKAQNAQGHVKEGVENAKAGLKAAGDRIKDAVSGDK
ncbi:MAG: CsbD family protein [Acidipropionibacterium sp.]|jgi:uncharacterized protein YjbJ (UPF0337 family)|nr:CsbD family protein [Acidipropionibacterium sp.]